MIYGIIVKRKLTYFGHMCRNTNSSITKTIVQGKVEGKRRRGRPKISYMDNVRQWTGMSTQSVFKATLDRVMEKQVLGVVARSQRPPGRCCLKVKVSKL